MDERCESDQHVVPDQCWGELWECESCCRTVCFAEGTDNGLNICDT